MTMKEYLLRYVGKQKRLILLSLVSVFVFLLANLSLPKLVGLSLDAIGSIVDGRFLLAIDFPLLTIYLSVGLVLAVLGVIFDFIFEYTIGVMTQRIDCSEPAAGIVSTAKTGSARSGFARPSKKSQTSPSYSRPSATALAVSITEPPPTATIA